MSRKIRVGILYGGRSGEHEVSVSSARSLIAAIDRQKFDVIPIGISRQGKWLLGTDPAQLENSRVPESAGHDNQLVVDVSSQGLVQAGHIPGESGGLVDVVFPLLHGPFGEDGTVQGMLEMAGVPYIGADVLPSAVGMDKGIMKALFEHAGLPGPRYRIFVARAWTESKGDVIATIENEIGLPVFVKPSRLGSSVGITRAATTDELWSSVTEAFAHDTKIIVEEEIRGREIECGVLGNHDPTISVFGEIVSKHEFYDYEAKYTVGLADLVIPARLNAGHVSTLTDIALRAFAAIDACGMARVDFFIEGESNRVILNEINTIPGFAPTSMFPKLWAASGLSYGELFERLVELAFERHEETRNRG